MSSNTSASPAPFSASAPIALPEATSKATKTVGPKAAKGAAPKTAKPKVAKKVPTKPAAAHPPWKELIKECIIDSDAPARQGVSRNTIKKYAEQKYGLSSAANVSQLNRAILSGVEAGIFVQPKGPSGCVKLAPKVRSDASKENSKPVSKSTSKTAALKTSKVPAAKKTAIKPKTAAAKAKKAIVGAKAAPCKGASQKGRRDEVSHHLEEGCSVIIIDDAFLAPFILFLLHVCTFTMLRLDVFMLVHA
ncbi:hypothetical protein B0H11DRAFT_1044813 [Mycena galericulata]|nr:hypothetical protein B0H11DRAFT_1044813 [Mycena galericulata]